MKQSLSDIPPILVTGATGRHGGTGRAVVENLIGRGLPVRALVRTLDERAERLRQLGAEIVVGDYADYRSLVGALDGVKKAYFCYPVGAGIAEAAGLFATAGRAQGLERVVDLSLGSTSPDGASPQVRAQWVAEQIFEWAGFGGVHLRVAAFFLENILLIDAPAVSANNQIGNAFGDTPLDWIAAADVGAVAANLIADPAASSDRTLTLGASQRLTYRGIAEILTDILGHTVSYTELPPKDWHERLVAASLANGEANVRGADHLVAQAIMVRSRPLGPLTNQIETITGRTPVDFSAFAAGHKSLFLPERLRGSR